MKANRVQETSDQQGEQSQDCSNENERINMHQLEPIQRVIPGLLREELETNDLQEISFDSKLLVWVKVRLRSTGEMI